MDPGRGMPRRSIRRPGPAPPTAGSRSGLVHDWLRPPLPDVAAELVRLEDPACPLDGRSHARNRESVRRPGARCIKRGQREQPRHETKVGVSLARAEELPHLVELREAVARLRRGGAARWHQGEVADSNHPRFCCLSLLIEPPASQRRSRDRRLGAKCRLKCCGKGTYTFLKFLGQLRVGSHSG